ncbi:MAG: amidoligase family protein [Acetobacteraceae bacterium]
MRKPTKIVSSETLIGFEAEFWFYNDGVTITPGWRLERRVADRLETHHLGTKVVAGRDGHLGSRPPRRGWTVVEERELPQHFHADNPDYVLRYGMEIVSPPLPISELKPALLKVADFIAAYGVTDENCGVHFNISVPTIDRLDPVKLVLMLPDERLLRYYGRGGTDKLRSIRTELAARAAQSAQYAAATTRQERLEALRQCLPIGKDYSLNFKRWIEGWGYLEFRQCGGRNWFEACQALFLTATHLGILVEIACDDAGELNAYFVAERMMKRRITRIKS